MSPEAKDFVGAGGTRSAGVRSPVVVPLADVHDSHGAANFGPGASPGAAEVAPSAQPERRIRLVDCALTLREAAARPEPECRSIFAAGGMPLGFYGVGHGPGGIGKTREFFRAVVLRALGRPWHGWEPSDEQVETIARAFP